MLSFFIYKSALALIYLFSPFLCHFFTFSLFIRKFHSDFSVNVQILLHLSVAMCILTTIWGDNDDDDGCDYDCNHDDDGYDVDDGCDDDDDDDGSDSYRSHPKSCLTKELQNFTRDVCKVKRWNFSTFLQMTDDENEGNWWFTATTVIMMVKMRRLKLLLSHEKVQMEQEERKELRANCAAEYTTNYFTFEWHICPYTYIKLCLQLQQYTGAINQQIMHFKCK